MEDHDYRALSCNIMQYRAISCTYVYIYIVVYLNLNSYLNSYLNLVYVISPSFRPTSLPLPSSGSSPYCMPMHTPPMPLTNLNWWCILNQKSIVQHSPTPSPIATHQEGQGVGVQREVEWPLSVCNVTGKSKRRCQEGRIESRVEIQRDYSLQWLQHFSTQFWRSEANESVKELTTKDYQRKQPESHIVIHSLVTLPLLSLLTQNKLE